MAQHKTLTPTNIATELGIQSITLRRWCSAFSEYLSPLANPGSGQARRFTGKDLEVLRYVRSLRDQDRSLVDIAGLLKDKTFTEIDTPPNDTNLAIVDALDAPEPTPANLVVVDAINTL